MSDAIRSAAEPPELTVILPVFNEAPNLALLWPELLSVLDAHWPRAQIIFVDDASTDAAADRRLHGQRDPGHPSSAAIRAVEVRRAQPGRRAFRDLLLVRWMHYRALGYSVEPDA